MKAIQFIVAAALLLGGHAKASFVFVYNTEAFENEQVLRFWFQRDGDTNLVQTVEYFTKDGTARSGVHYIASTGTVTFAVGQSRSSVEVPLIDNGLVNGERFFELVPHRPGPGVTNRVNDGWNCNPFWVGVIRDNELPLTRVDPLFVPDRGPGDFAAPMPDDRVLVSGGSKGITMLQSNGWVDPTFRPGDASVPGPFRPLHVFADGKILTRQPLMYPQQRFVRLLPNGAVDAVFPIFTDEPGPTFAAAQADGKILVVSRTNLYSVLVRLNLDGTEDREFMQGLTDNGRINAVIVQPDGKILVAGSFRRIHSVVRSSLARLNPDGSLDHTFSPVLARSDGRVPEIFGLLGRRNGKVIVTGYFQTVNGADRCCFAQLHSDGSLDSSFNPPSMFADWDKGFFHYGLTVEQPDGGLIISPSDTSVMRLNADGSVDPTFAADLHSLPVPCQVGRDSNHGLGITASGDLLLAGYFDQVDGFPRNRFVRLLDMRPQNDFRVVTPAEFYRSSGVARLEVVRTGPTTNAASVSFSTRDETAKAGEDYVSQSDTLNFAPLEVSKTILVPLLARTGVVERLAFKLELRNPSVGYTNTVPTPIVILPDLRIASESLRVGGNSIRITLRGTLPGIEYALESSSDLNSWTWVAGSEAVGSTTVFGPFVPSASAEFYRARRQ